MSPPAPRQRRAHATSTPRSRHVNAAFTPRSTGVFPFGQAAETAPGQGDLFAVDLVGEGLVIRLARRDVQTDSLRLTALAPTTPPLRLPLAETGHRLLGRVVWVAQLL